MTQEQLDRGYELQEEIHDLEYELEKLKTYFKGPKATIYLHTMKGVSHYVIVPRRIHGVVHQLLFDTYMGELLQLRDELAAL